MAQKVDQVGAPMYTKLTGIYEHGEILKGDSYRDSTLIFFVEGALISNLCCFFLTLIKNT